MGLLGTIYDLKQTQQRKPTGVTSESYVPLVDEFLKSDWDETILNKYFRGARPLITTQIFIPIMGANAAPKAYGVEGVIKPALWVAHYKGQVTPPEDGTYRFVGFSDDLLALAVNGKTVLFGGKYTSKVWKSLGGGAKAGNGNLAYGEWIPMKKTETIDLDVLIGERPGVHFCAFLLYQKQGETYPMKDGHPVLPIFQLAPYDTPEADKIENGTPFSKSNKLWKGHQ
ncbi:MAG TPA: hypothetical protein VF585_07040 [Chthoniobacterales bacterium]